MIRENLILETINMIKLYNLDIRTVTLAISLRDCISDDIDKLCDNIYNKITKYAKNLVEYSDELYRIGNEFREKYNKYKKDFEKISNIFHSFFVAN